MREALTSLRRQRPEHAGLWLDSFVEGNNAEEYKPYLQKATTIQVPHQYVAWLRTLEEQLQRSKDTEVYLLATGRNRVICGLGNASSWENAVTMHRTWGVPMIPGSSLKGLAASFASENLVDESWHRDATRSDGPKGRSHEALFGSVKLMGGVTFLDALWFPSEQKNPDTLGLALDVVTVHHPRYYGKQGREAAADWDSPQPIPFLSVSGAFLFALRGPAEYRKAAAEILEMALMDDGIGAKTSSGYGRMTMEKRKSSDELRAEKLEQELQNFSFPEYAQDLDRMKVSLEKIHELAGEDWHRCLERLGARFDDEKDKTRKKSRSRTLREFLGGDDDAHKSAWFEGFVAFFRPRVGETASDADAEGPWNLEKVMEAIPASLSEDEFKGRLKSYIQQHDLPKDSNKIVSALSKARGTDKKSRKAAEKTARQCFQEARSNKKGKKKRR